jgi:adhesin/invasin
LTATVTDDNQNPVQDGTSVRFIILPGGSGSVVGTSLTDDGVATSTITSGVDGDTVHVEASMETARDTVEVFFKAMVLALSSDPTVLSADGKAKATITALLRDEDNIPIEGKQIDFRTTIGTIPSPRTTDQNGLAQTTLTSEQENGVAVITAETGNLSTTFPVAFSGITMTVTASPSNLVADGSSTSTITASLVDPNGDAVANRPVTFGVESAEISPQTVTTEPDGKAIAYLKSSTAGTKTVTAAGAGALGEVDVTFTGFTFNISADPQSITAGLDSTEISAQLLDSDLDPVTGAVVNFSATLGQIADSGVTNSLGQARVWFSSTSTGTAVITATALLGDTLEVSSSISVEIGSSPSANLVLTANPRVVKVNGGTSTLTAVVTDANLNPVANASVGFRLLSGPHGGENLNPATATTSGNGLATTTFTAGSIASAAVNDVDIMAFIPGIGVESEVVEMTIAGAPKHITVGYSLPPKTQDGSYSLSVAAIVSDISGNAVVDGTLVLFSINPVIGAITSPVATTNGQATTSLIYPPSQAGTAVSLLAESGGISADAVNLVLPGASGVIANVELEAADNSILADGQSQTSVTALVEDPNGSPVGDVVVQFQSQLGSIQSPVKSEPKSIGGTENPNWGKATTTLTSRADTTTSGLLDQITAVAGGITSDPIDIEYKGISLTVSSDDDAINADGISTTTVRAILKQKDSNVPITSATVYFGTDLGTIVGSAPTNSSGVATTTLTAADQAGTANINAIYGPSIVKTTSVEFVTSTVEPGDPALIIIAIGLLSDREDTGLGTYKIPVSAIVSDDSGNPVEDGLDIIFSLPGSSGEMVIESVAKTNNGVATTTLTYDHDVAGDPIQIRAEYDGLVETDTKTLP